MGQVILAHFTFLGIVPAEQALYGVWDGRLAQLVEHLVYTERVGGSSPSSPTIKGHLDTRFALCEMKGQIVTKIGSIKICGCSSVG